MPGCDASRAPGALRRIGARTRDQARPARLFCDGKDAGAGRYRKSGSGKLGIPPVSHPGYDHPPAVRGTPRNATTARRQHLGFPAFCPAPTSPSPAVDARPRTRVSLRLSCSIRSWPLLSLLPCAVRGVPSIPGWLDLERFVHDPVSLQSGASSQLLHPISGFFLIRHKEYLRGSDRAVALSIALRNYRAEAASIMLNCQSDDHGPILVLRAE